MTFCVAWKNRNGIYMVADSAVTSPDYNSLGITSAGQKHRRINGNTVKEGAWKIVIKKPLSLLLFNATKKPFNPFKFKFGYYNANNCDVQDIIKKQSLTNKYDCHVDKNGVLHLIDKVTKEYFQFSDHQLKSIPKK